MMEMSAELHDKSTLEPQFLTQLIGRIIDEQKLRSTPVDTVGLKLALRLAETTTAEPFDDFYALFTNNPKAGEKIAR